MSQIPRPLLIDLAGVTVCITLTVVVFIVGIRPRWREQNRQQQLRVALERKQQAANRVHQTLVATRAHVQRTQQVLSHQSARLGGLDELNTRLASLTALAEACRMEVAELEPGEAMADKHDVVVPIRLVGRGDFAAAADFVHRLHARMSDVVVASFALAGHPAAKANSPAALGFKLRWHAAAK